MPHIPYPLRPRHILLKLMPEMPNRCCDRPGRCLAERADGLALDFALHVPEQVNVRQGAFAVEDFLDDALHPARAFPTGTALAAALVVVETGECVEVPDDARVLVHDDEAAAAEHGARCEAAIGEALVAHEARFASSSFKDEVLGQDGHGRTARHYRLQVLAVADAAAVFVGVDELLHGHTQFDFVNPRLVDMAAGRDEFRARALADANASVGVAAHFDDGHDGGDGFHVVYHRGAIPKALDSWERRLKAGITTLAFEAFEQGSLLTADVGTCPDLNVAVVVEAAAEDVLAEQSSGISLVNRLFEDAQDVEILAPDVDVRGVRPQRKAADYHALHQQVRDALHQVAVLESARLALVSIADEVAGHALRLGQEAPLHTRGEARTAPAPQAGLLHLLHDGIGGHAERLFQGLVAAVLPVHLQAVDAGDVVVFK